MGFDNPAAAQSARANQDFSGLGSSILFNINSAYRAEDEIRRFSKVLIYDMLLIFN
jgi:hypothetical protein